MGYLWDEANTQKLIDVYDWVHSGDLGRVDQDGFFYVTGRLKVHLYVGKPPKQDQSLLDAIYTFFKKRHSSQPQITLVNLGHSM